jgi:hypothetical protein
MSFDNIGQHFEYVRHGSNWKLMKHNLNLIKTLMKNNGHWGGAHAVYNIYNATRFVEFRQFLNDNEITIVWQNLFQPDFLDPFLHGNKLAELASNEIQNFYRSGLATSAEKIFFDQALTNYQSTKTSYTEIEQKFKQHLYQIENQYHKDQHGKFAELWPELAYYLE